MRHYGPIPRTFEQSIPEFWKKVKRGDIDECWPWLGATLPDGYGKFRADGKFIQAHRFAYIISNGSIPATLCVLHECDNPPCCNANHLFTGTRKDNSDDRDKKGRNVNLLGEEHGGSKLTEADVRLIRADYIPFHFTVSMLATRHGVSVATIKQILSRKTWKHL